MKSCKQVRWKGLISTLFTLYVVCQEEKSPISANFVKSKANLLKALKRRFEKFLTIH